MIPVISNAPNATYESAFTGPLMTCRSLNSTEALMMSNVQDYYESQNTASSRSTFLAYLALMPSPMFLDGDGQVNNTFDYETFWSDCVEDDTTSSSPICSKGSTNATNGYFWVKTGNSSWACNSWNATFQATFDLGASSQTVTVNTATLGTLGPAYTTIDMGYLNTRSNYDTLFGLLRKLLCGFLSVVPQSGGGADGSTTLHLTATDTLITQTALLGAVDWVSLAEKTGISDSTISSLTTTADADLARNKTIGELIQELSMNVTLSFFSTGRLW